MLSAPLRFRHPCLGPLGNQLALEFRKRREDVKIEPPAGALVLASRSTRGVDFNVASVNTLIGIVPPVIMYLFVQRFLARGLSFGAVKG